MWRHALFSILERVFPSGTVPLLREAMRLKMRAAKLGLHVEILHGTLPSETSPYAHPFADNDARTTLHSNSCVAKLFVDIVLIIVGNPKGLISSHHEKLLMADAECPAHTIACTGV